MFDRLAYYERHLLLNDEEDEFDSRDEDASYWADLEGPGYTGDYDTPFGDLARIADDIEAGRVELPPRWKLDRPSPVVQVWTTPSGRRYACDVTGEQLPLPDGEAQFHAWT